MKTLCLLAIVLLAQAKIFEFNSEAIDEIFKKERAALIMLANAEQASIDARAAFQGVDETNPDFALAISAPDDGHNFYDRLAGFLGLEDAVPPQVVYLSSKSEKYMFEGQTISKETLLAFAQQIADGTIQPFFKSAEIPEDDGSYVKVVVGKNFKQVVMESEKEVLAKFYAPWCGHCKTLAPHFEAVARKLANNPNILLVKVDSTENEVAGIEIEGYPTVKFFGKDKSLPPLEFEGERTEEGILKWLQKNTQYPWVEIVEEEEM